MRLQSLTGNLRQRFDAAILVSLLHVSPSTESSSWQPVVSLPVLILPPNFSQKLEMHDDLFLFRRTLPLQYRTTEIVTLGETCYRVTLQLQKFCTAITKGGTLFPPVERGGLGLPACLPASRCPDTEKCSDETSRPGWVIRILLQRDV